MNVNCQSVPMHYPTSHNKYGKCSKISNTLPAKKAWTHREDPDQTASEEAV